MFLTFCLILTSRNGWRNLQQEWNCQICHRYGRSLMYLISCQNSIYQNGWANQWWILKCLIYQQCYLIYRQSVLHLLSLLPEYQRRLAILPHRLVKDLVKFLQQQVKHSALFQRQQVKVGQLFKQNGHSYRVSLMACGQELVVQQVRLVQLLQAVSIAQWNNSICVGRLVKLVVF